MKPHSVVDTITNSSSVEFMIPNPDGFIYPDEFMDMMAAALIDDVNNYDEGALRIILHFLPDGDDIWREFPSEEWPKEINKHYSDKDIIKAANKWVESEVNIEWTDADIFCSIPEPGATARVYNLIINKLSGSFI